MQLILDNLLATIVASVIFLMLVTVMQRSQQNTIDSINYYALKKQELSFIGTMKQDLSSVDSVVTVQEQSDGSFKFVTQLYANSPVKYEINYKREFVGMRNDDSLFQIKRYEKDLTTGMNTYAGSSLLTVTGWEIEARTAAGEPAGIPEAAKQIYVRFEATLPFETVAQDNSSLMVQESRWEATFRPPLLVNKDALL